MGFDKERLFVVEFRSWRVLSALTAKSSNREIFRLFDLRS